MGEGGFRKVKKRERQNIKYQDIRGQPEGGESLQMLPGKASRNPST